MKPFYKLGNFFFLFLFVSLTLLSPALKAQTTISTTFTNNNGFATCTFNFENTNASSVIITDIASVCGAAGTQNVSAWFKPSAINGPPGAISNANGWTQFGSAVITGIANTTTSTPQPFMSGLTLTIPAGQTYGIAVTADNLRYSSLTAGTYTASGGGCNLITGTNIGYAGGLPPVAPANTPRGFIGSVTFVGSTPCSGTPAPGNTVSTANPVCPGINFTLSPQNVTLGSGVTYQWQSSPNNTTYTDIAGATSSNYTTSQTAATWYKVKVTCGANSTFTTALNVTMAGATSCYCSAGATSTGFEKISNVAFNTINNPSTSTAGYESFTNLSTTVNPGSTYPLTVTISGGFATDEVMAWIDYNQDGDFVDAGETVYTSAPGVGPHTGNITIPAGATAGNTRLRIRMHDNGAGAGGNATPCGTSTYGQVEDYTINVGTSSGCSGTPAPGNTISTANAVCPSVSFSLSPQNATSGTGVTYQWQSSPTGAVYTDISGATSSIYATSQTVATYYRVRVTCGANSTNSNPLQVTMNLPTSCYCTPPSTNCNASDVITNVTFGTLNNTSACSANGYSDYTATVAAPNISIGTSTPISVTVGPGGTEYVGVWIDYNQNGVFDATEFTAVGSANGAVVNGTIAIPATALSGITRMRVRVRYNLALTGADPCLGYTYGETEDYKINLTCSASVTTQPANVSASCGSNAVFTVAGTGNPTFQWQVSTNGGGTWTNVTNTPPYSGATTNQLTVTGVNTTLNTYQYRAVLSNSCTAGLNSNAATLTVLIPSIPVVIPPSATVCLGGITPISLSTAVPGPQLTITTETGTGYTGGSGVIGGSTCVTFVINNTNSTAITLKQVDVWWNTVTTVGSTTPALWYTSSSLSGPPTIVTPVWTKIVTAPVLNVTASGIIPTFTGLSFSIPANTQYRFAVESTNGISYSPPTATPTIFSTGGVDLKVSDQQIATQNVGYAGGFPSPINNPRAFTGRIIFSGSVLAPTAGIISPVAGLYTDPGATIPYTGTSLSTIYAKPAVTTTYNVSAGVTGCLSASVPVTITVNTPASFTAQPTAVTICENGSATFAATATGTAPLSYQWQVSADGGTSWTNIGSANSNSYTVIGATPSMNGNLFRLAATSAAPCGPTFSNAVALTVRPLPVVTITANPTTKLIPTTTTTLTANVAGAAAASYRWFRNGTQVTGATGATLVVNIDQLGDYTAIVTDVNGCISLISAKLNITDSATGRVFLYPNPNKGKFHVRYYSEFYPNGTTPGGPITSSILRYIGVYNAQGQRIMNKPFSVTASYGSMDVDLSPWGSGVYWIEICDVNGKRLVVGRAVVL